MINNISILKNITILYAEDDLITQESIARILKIFHIIIVGYIGLNMIGII